MLRKTRSWPSAGSLYALHSPIFPPWPKLILFYNASLHCLSQSNFCLAGTSASAVALSVIPSATV